MKQVKVGDVIAIPLAEDLIGAGLIIFVAKEIKGGIIVGLYKQAFKSAGEIQQADLGVDFLETPNYTDRHAIYIGRWKIVTHRCDLLELTSIPILRSAEYLYRGDERLNERRLPFEDWDKYTSLITHGTGAVENLLRKHLQNR